MGVDKIPCCMCSKDAIVIEDGKYYCAKHGLELYKQNDQEKSKEIKRKLEVDAIMKRRYANG